MSITRAMSRRSLIGGAAGLAAYASLSACGGGSSTFVANSRGKVAVTVMRPANTGFEPVVIAKEQGFFSDHGLDVTFAEASADTSANIPRLTNGEVQFVNGGAPQAIKAVAGGLDVQLVTGIQSSEANASPTDGLLVPGDSAVRSFADLEGKKIGVSGIGGTTNLVNNILARKAGADPVTFTYVNLEPPALQEAATKGQVDAVLIFGLYYSKATKSGFRIISDGTTSLPGTLQIGYIATTDFLDEHADLAEKFNAAIATGIKYANKHPDAVRATQREYTELPDSYITSMKPLHYSATMDTATTAKLSAELIKLGDIDSAPSDDQLFWSEAPTR
ncbi:MAG: ABC transporter substrate-binding protein [Nocardioides sp.]|uniref:ABC transporter substrate-binding protein n=1 Tax=Nocardioides sp. TaxID=35761 RepID=UPI0039E6EF25